MDKGDRLQFRKPKRAFLGLEPICTHLPVAMVHASLKRLGFLIAGLGWLGFTPFSTLAITGSPSTVTTEPRPMPRSSAIQPLLQMFSPEIRATLNACANHGRVNLAAGASQDGWVICGDGSPELDITFNHYINTLSDILAASSLVGFHIALADNPQLSSEMLAAFLANSQGTAVLQNAIEIAVAQNQLLSTSSPESVSLLSNAVIERLQIALRSPNSLDQLFGTDDQYAQVVEQFCTVPGLSISEAQSAIPGLSPIQLYAICIQESGLANQPEFR